MVLLIVVVALLSSVTPLGTDMYLPALPAMAHQFGSSPSDVQLTLTAFMAGLTAGQLLWGPVSDQYGRRGPLLVGTAIAAASTTACALAPTLGWLIVLRLVQGLSSAAGLVVGRAVVADVTSGRRAARVFGVLMTLVSTAPIVAPLLGGAVFAAAGWRAVFWTLAGLGVAMLAGVALAVPETYPRRERGTGATSQMLPAAWRVLSHRHYLGYALSFALAYGALFCYVSGSSFVYQNVLGLSVGQYTVAFTASAGLTTVTSALSAKLVTRVHPRRLLHNGLTAMVAAAALLFALAASTGLGIAGALPLFAVFFLGLGLVVANATALALDQVPHAAGTGSAVLGALQTGLAAAIAPLIGLAGAHTALPMLAGMAAATTAALFALRLTHHSSGNNQRATTDNTTLTPAQGKLRITDGSVSYTTGGAVTATIRCLTREYGWRSPAEATQRGRYVLSSAPPWGELDIPNSTGRVRR